MFNFEKYFIKFCQSFIFSHCVMLWINRYFFYLEYVNKFNYILFFSLLVGLFILSLLLSKCLKMNDHLGMIIALFLYFLSGVYFYQNFYFTLSAILVLLVYLYYLIHNRKLEHVFLKIETIFKKKEKMHLYIIIGLSVFIFIFIAGLTIYRNISFNSSCFDFGVFSQMFHYMKEKFIPFTTCERNILLNHFDIHMSPIYYLILPIYMIFPFTNTLLIVQALTIVSGVIPLYLICKKYNLKNFQTLIFCFVYLLHPALTNGAFFDFHENKIYPILILWFIYFLENKKNSLIYLFLFLILIVKEDSFIYPLSIGLFYFFGKKEKKGLIISAVSILYFGIIFTYLMHYGYEGPMSYRFDNFISDLDLGLLSVVKTIFFNPLYLFKEIFVVNKLVFMLQVLLPLGFLIFFVKKISYLILIIPFIIINLISNYVYQFDIGFQYTYGSVPILIYLSIINFKEIRSINIKKGINILMVLSTVFLASNYLFPKSFYLYNYYQNREVILEIKDALKLIDDESSVTASTFFVPYLSQREYIYMLPVKDILTDYVVIDIRSQNDEYNKYYKQYLDLGYKEVYHKPNRVVILSIK